MASCFPTARRRAIGSAFQKALDDIAAHRNAPGTTSRCKVLKSDFSQGVELLADNVLHPALPGRGLCHRQAADRAISSQAGSRAPAILADRALRAGLLPADDPRAPRGHAGNLSRSDARRRRAVPRDDVPARPRDHRRDRRCHAAARRGGDREWFGAWRAAGHAARRTCHACPPMRHPQRSRARSQRRSVVGGAGAGSRDHAIRSRLLRVAAGQHVLGGGFYATRLYHDLRQENGYVYNVDDNLTATKTRSVYTVSTAAIPENIVKARDLIVRDLRAMQTTDVTPQELQQAKALLLRQMPLRESSEEAVAGGLLARAQIGLPLDEPARGADDISR